MLYLTEGLTPKRLQTISFCIAHQVLSHIEIVSFVTVIIFWRFPSSILSQGY